MAVRELISKKEPATTAGRKEHNQTSTKPHSLLQKVYIVHKNVKSVNYFHLSITTSN
jgi:hypothetical protein